MVSSRTKGADGEREAVARLEALGVPAEKVSRSGHPGPDLIVAGSLVTEVKRRKQQYSAAQQIAHLGTNDLLMWRLDYGKWHVTMNLDMLAELLS